MFDVSFEIWFFLLISNFNFTLITVLRLNQRGMLYERWIALSIGCDFSTVVKMFERNFEKITVRWIALSRLSYNQPQIFDLLNCVLFSDLASPEPLRRTSRAKRRLLTNSPSSPHLDESQKGGDVVSKTGTKSILFLVSARVIFDYARRSFFCENC